MVNLPAAVENTGLLFHLVYWSSTLKTTFQYVFYFIDELTMPCEWEKPSFVRAPFEYYFLLFWDKFVI